MNRKIIWGITIVCVVVVSILASIILINPSWKTTEQLFNFNENEGKSIGRNGLDYREHLKKGDTLIFSGSVEGDRVDFMISEDNNNGPTPSREIERVDDIYSHTGAAHGYGGTNSWNYVWIVPEDNSYDFTFNSVGNSFSNIQVSCLREYTQHLIT